MRAPPCAPPPGIHGRYAAFPPGGTGNPPAPRPFPARSLLAADRYGETFAPLRAPAGKDRPPGRRRHPLAESMGALPPEIVRLVRAFHVCAPSFLQKRRNIAN